MLIVFWTEDFVSLSKLPTQLILGQSHIYQLYYIGISMTLKVYLCNSDIKIVFHFQEFGLVFWYACCLHVYLFVIHLNAGHYLYSVNFSMTIFLSKWGLQFLLFKVRSFNTDRDWEYSKLRLSFWRMVFATFYSIALHGS